jgi:hypothetical protein
MVAQGSERSRRAANYQTAKALFLLLRSAAYQSIRPNNPEGLGHARAGKRSSRTSPYPFDALRNQVGSAKST